mmetsp:Transcript_23186/g.39238  ORF Transcript_23186/g.39238 Transcript_23186/m.39238 type:complete len:212 (-) Transcript_23186:2078-2713(-)
MGRAGGPAQRHHGPHGLHASQPSAAPTSPPQGRRLDHLRKRSGDGGAGERGCEQRWDPHGGRCWAAGELEEVWTCCLFAERSPTAGRHDAGGMGAVALPGRRLLRPPRQPRLAAGLLSQPQYWLERGLGAAAGQGLRAGPAQHCLLTVAHADRGAVLRIRRALHCQGARLRPQGTSPAGDGWGRDGCTLRAAAGGAAAEVVGVGQRPLAPG